MDGSGALDLSKIVIDDSLVDVGECVKCMGRVLVSKELAAALAKAPAAARVQHPEGECLGAPPAEKMRQFKVLITLWEDTGPHKEHDKLAEVGCDVEAPSAASAVTLASTALAEKWLRVREMASLIDATDVEAAGDGDGGGA